MIVNVVGRMRRERREHLIRFAGFAIMVLCPGLRSLKIDIFCKKNLIQKAECIAQCYRQGPRYYLIEIDSGLPMRTILASLAHELVHVKQYVRGELSYDGENEIFRGEVYGPDHGYWDLPSEIEAHGRERGLLFRYIEEYGFHQEPWADLNA